MKDLHIRAGLFFSIHSPLTTPYSRASKRDFEGNPMKLSREKIQSLAGQIHRLLLEDGEVEYFVGDDELRLAVLRALEHELAKDEEREARARHKVRTIRRNIPEDSPEFHALYMQFYKELLDKGL